MKKTTALKIVNPIVGVLFIVQAGSGMLNEQIPYEIFSGMHGIVGWFLTAFVGIHIYLNWTWVVTTFLRKKSKR